MTKLAKLLIGGAATSLLAWGAHATGGETFVAGLGDNASAAASATGIEGASVAMDSGVALSRVALLSGDMDDAARAELENAVLAVPGIASVKWADGSATGAGSANGSGDGSSDGAGEDAVTAAAVTECQIGVDAAIAEKSINFRSGSTFMPDSSLAVVTEVADALKDCGGLTVSVGGHTDATGSAEVNQNLSQGRADAVAAALTERGIAGDRITATGFGSTRLKVPGDGANKANRRIEFTVSGAAASATTEGGK